MQDFKSLKVWQVAHHLTLRIYSITRKFPREEQFGLTSQIRRCASSIPANIAEGCGRDSKRDFARFLDISGGSANELEYHLLLVRDLNMIETTEYDELVAQLIEVRKMLTAFVQRLRADEKS
jgi:four helix bundle protein